MKNITNKATVVIGLAFCLFLAANTGRAAELQPDTINSWNNFIAVANARMRARLDPAATFLWADEDPGRTVRVKEGQVEVAPMTGRGAESVPNGLIHDWIGAAFIPSTSLEQVLSTLGDYNRYKEFFGPQVIDSRLTSHSDDSDQFSIRLVNKVLFVSAGIDTQGRAEVVRVGRHRSYATSYTTRVQEIQNFGQPNERKLAPDQGNGFIWRLYSIARYEERDGGVYLEIEAIALTRDIPGSLRFVMTPLVKKLSRNSLLLSLRQSRDAVRASTEISTGAVTTMPPGRTPQLAHGMFAAPQY